MMDRAMSPIARDQACHLEGAPSVVGDHADAAGDRHDRDDAPRLLGCAGIKTLDAAADPRIGAHRGADHAGHLDIDAKCRRPR